MLLYELFLMVGNKQPVWLFRLATYPENQRAKATPLKSIVNGINVTLRHLLQSTGTVLVMGESLKLRQRNAPRKDKKDEDLV